ncbi:MAG: hypothetical protein DRP71_11555 [Verrucomicrobia bacterium]|nr:MAG: hypothetical protein DRP71_11555 [Verrucomicrobiota bacterium]
MKKSQILMIVGSLMLLFLFVFPMWNIQLEAPQYPSRLGMDIYITKIADENPHDLKNINLMNHYIGMAEIPEHMTEFIVFPAVVISMVLLGIAIGIKGTPNWFLGWFILMSVLGCAGIYDFYLWMYDYGHSLDPKAILNFTNPDGTPMAYQPPLIGTKQILNFTAHSYPKIAAYLMFAGMGMTVAAFFVGRKEAKAMAEIS